MTLTRGETLAQAIVEAGVYRTYWDKPKQEWPVSEQGRICPAYCNLRSLIGDVSMRRMVNGALIDSIKGAAKQEPDVLCGIVSAGVPWASMASDATNIAMCYTRPSIKAHGERTGIEGMLRPGMHAGVIDDVFLTGNTITKSSLQLSAQGVEISEITVLLRLSDREANIHRPDGTFESMPVTALFDYQDLLNASMRLGHMNQEQAERLAMYYNDPETQPWE